MISEVAKRYAHAIYDLAQSSADSVLGELQALNKIFEADKTISDFLNSPLFSPDQKATALKAALNGKVSDTVVHSLLLLAEKSRLSFFSSIVEAYAAIRDEKGGITRGTVKSATPLNADARKQIEDTVTKVTQKKVLLTFTEDPKLLGGMVAQVGGWTFDDSLESHLTRLNEELNRRSH